LRAEAIIFEQPGSLIVDAVDLNEPGPGDVVVEMLWSGISTGTEKLFWTGRMPWFPGHGYPLVPGYEGVGTVVEAGAESGVAVGQRVFVPGATCYKSVRGLFGASASHVVVAGERVAAVDQSAQATAVLWALAATAQHTISGSPNAGKALVVGHGVLGRLIARLLIARDGVAPTVWEKDPARAEDAEGYTVTTSEADETRDYQVVFDVSGDPTLIDTLISRIAKGGEVVLAGFYAEPIQFNFPPAFMREARKRIAAEWIPADLDQVRALLDEDRLSLDHLISHRALVSDAHHAYATAFDDPRCTKMILDWRALP